MDGNIRNNGPAGDAGSGKTVLLNAIIREYYNVEKEPTIIKNIGNNENVLSINSLKEQGITYYRNDMKTFCQTQCLIPGKKKIMILDDLDNINEQSQQVFRNCMDKYSHNVHFIASCNNTHKVIDSLQSRMTIIKIKSLQEKAIHKIVEKICGLEQIQLRPEVGKFIISISNNSMRIIINYLEKFKLLQSEITLELAMAVCTNITFTDFALYTHYCKIDQNLQAAVALIYNLFDKGYSVMDILDNYFLFVKTTEMLTEEEKYMIIPLLCKYITIFHNIHEDEIELALFTNNLLELLKN